MTATESARRVVVIDLSAERIGLPYAMEGPAAEVWRSLGDLPRHTTEIVDELADLYREPGERIRSDVEAFLEQLVERGLAERVVDDGAGRRPS